MAYVLVTNTNVQSVFSQGSYDFFDFQTNVTYSGNLTLPLNSVLRFSGGKLTVMGNLVGQNTVIEAPLAHFLQVTGSISGNWHIGMAYPEWFGAVGDGVTDCSIAISKALCLGASELHFSKGVYKISSTIIVTGTNIAIAGGATITTSEELDYMIQCDYTVSNSSPFGMKALKTIYGGGCLDGQYVAKCGIAMRSGYRAIIRDVTIKNIDGICLKTTYDETKYGPVLVQGCVFQNPRGVDNGAYNSTIDSIGTNVAILNNSYGSVFENIDIVNFKIAVKHKAENATYNNVHAWLFHGNSYWSNSAVFECYVPDLTLYRCDADTMRSLIKVRETDDSNNTPINQAYFFANILNCQAYRNPNIVDDELLNNYHPKVVDMGSMSFTNGVSYSQLTLMGGNYYYDNNEYTNFSYAILTKKSEYDIISINRYNRAGNVLCNPSWY